MKKFNKMHKVLIAMTAVSTAIAVTACTPSITTDPVQSDTAKSDTAKPLNNPSANKPKPSIVYIVLDDMGFSDWGAFGSEIKTPNIDQLAADGLRYNNLHVAPMSSPTRASLLTGRDHSTVGMGYITVADLGPERPTLRGSISENAGTTMEILHKNGYSSYGVGKYHVTPQFTINPAGPFDYWPLGKGYDRFYGFLDGETDQYNPKLVEGNEILGDVSNDPDYILNDDLLAHAKQYIGDHVSIYPEKPFFLNFSFGTGHSPLQVPESYVEQYKGLYEKGWDVIRQERFERMKKLGVIPADTVLPAGDPAVKPWNSLTDQEKKAYVRFMQVYAGFITQADEKIGQLVSYLKEIGAYDNTMFVIINDNGATADGTVEGTDTFLGALFTTPEETAARIKNKVDLIGGPMVGPMYPTGWAQVSNTPFKEYKGSFYEGGIRTPMVITWKNGNFNNKEKVRTQYVNVSDITATVLDIVKAQIPQIINDVEQLPITGVSIASTFDKYDAAETRTTQYDFMENHSYIYDKGWVALASHKMGTPFETDTWELYNMASDFTQTKNIANENPKKLDELKALFMEEAKKAGVLPLKELTTADKNFPNPASPSRRKTFKYYPNVGHINSKAAPTISGNMTITVKIDRPNTSSEGVLVAMGDNIGGYTLYIQNNKLVYEYNKFDVLSRIVSNIDVPVGKSLIKFDLDRKNVGLGIGTLYIDGEQVGQSNIKTINALSFEGMDIGKDLFMPVSKSYASKPNGFPFTGQFDHIRFDVSPIAAAAAPAPAK